MQVKVEMLTNVRFCSKLLMAAGNTQFVKLNTVVHKVKCKLTVSILNLILHLSNFLRMFKIWPLRLECLVLIFKFEDIGNR